MNQGIDEGNGRLLVQTRIYFAALNGPFQSTTARLFSILSALLAGYKLLGWGNAFNGSQIGRG